MTNSPLVVAIDGPAGSGKSSVSKEVARRRAFAYLDTGAAYRALAWHVLAREADTADAAAVIAAANDFDYAISTEPDKYWVRVGETDVTEAIREPHVQRRCARARGARPRDRAVSRDHRRGAQCRHRRRGP